MEENMNNKEKLEQMIEVAKQVLKENPDDTWVQKGLIEMQKEVDRLNKLEQEK
jgi:predicted CoA-binding protein